MGGNVLVLFAEFDGVMPGDTIRYPPLSTGALSISRELDLDMSLSPPPAPVALAWLLLGRSCH